MVRQGEQPVRPRYGRIAALGSSLTVTVVAVLGGAGMLPSAASDEAPAAIREVADSRPADSARATHPGERAADRARDARAVESAKRRVVHSGISSPGSPDAVEVRDRTTGDRALPLRSGEGRRIVFSENRQRVWLVGADGRVQRTYPVSGSVSDNLAPGTYTVYSRSKHAWGIDDSGTMEYFVRFAHGHHAAIGFHDIPVNHGHLVQSVSQLGTPQSHGCIRQRRPDAIALWRFAPLGTTVVVV